MWFNFIRARLSAPRSFHPVRRHPLSLESLEDRTVPNGTLLGTVGKQVDSVGPFIQAGNLVYFTVTLPETSGSLNELWVTNGTAKGTREVMPSAAAKFTNPFDMVADGSILYFNARDSANHIELWSYAGTGSPKEIKVGTSSNPEVGGLAVVNNTLYFDAFDGSGEDELWAYSGSGSPQEIVIPGVSQPSPSGFTLVGTTMYFLVDESGIWSLDTSNLSAAPVQIGGGYSFPSNLVAFDGRLFFSAQNFGGNGELWDVANDGSTAAEIDIESWGVLPNLLTPIGNTLYFFMQDQNLNFALWSFGGSGSASEITYPSPFDQVQPFDLTLVGNTLYFLAENGAATEVAMFEYPVSGTTVTQVDPGTGSDAYDFLTAVGDDLYFTNLDSSNHDQLWEYTGSGTPTVLPVGASGPDGPGNLSVIGSNLYLSDGDGSLGQEPWVLGAGPAPTVQVSDASGTYTGQPFTATATVNGQASLDGVSPTITYHAGSTATGKKLSAAPSAAGTYTAVATYPTTVASPSASNLITFTISPAAPQLAVTDSGSTATGKAFPATATATGIGGVKVSGTFTFAYTNTETQTTTSTAPTTAGNYTVVASFKSKNPDYANASSSPLPFTITPSVKTSSATLSFGAGATVILVIKGAGFSTEIADDVVALSSGSATVTKATATTLTLSLTGLSGGPLSATVKVNGVSSQSEEVANVVLTPSEPTRDEMDWEHEV